MYSPQHQQLDLRVSRSRFLKLLLEDRGCLRKRGRCRTWGIVNTTDVESIGALEKGYRKSVTRTQILSNTKYTISFDGDRSHGRRARDNIWRSSGRCPSHDRGSPEATHHTGLHIGRRFRGMIDRLRELKEIGSGKTGNQRECVHVNLGQQGSREVRKEEVLGDLTTVNKESPDIQHREGGIGSKEKGESGERAGQNEGQQSLISKYSASGRGEPETKGVTAGVLRVRPAKHEHESRPHRGQPPAPPFTGEAR